MGIAENKALATKFLGRLASGDMSGLFDMMADDGTWWIAGKPELAPMAGVKPKAEMVKILGGLGAVLKGPLAIKIIGVVAEGDKVAVEAESHGEVVNGRIYNNQYHFLFEMRAGKVQSVKEYCDTQHAGAVFSA